MTAAALHVKMEMINMIRYGKFIVHSKADIVSSPPHCTITLKIMTRSTVSSQETVESVLKNEKNSLWWDCMTCGKDRF